MQKIDEVQNIENRRKFLKTQLVNKQLIYKNFHHFSNY